MEEKWVALRRLRRANARAPGKPAGFGPFAPNNLAPQQANFNYQGGYFFDETESKVEPICEDDILWPEGEMDPICEGEPDQQASSEDADTSHLNTQNAYFFAQPQDWYAGYDVTNPQDCMFGTARQTVSRPGWPMRKLHLVSKLFRRFKNLPSNFVAQLFRRV